MTAEKSIDIIDSNDEKAVSRHAALALGRYDIRRPSFNLAANSDKLAPENKAFFIYPEEAHALIAASLMVLKELDQDKTVSRSTRERFAVEDAKDRLRGVESQMGAAEYRALYENTMSKVTAKQTGLESLAFGSTLPFEGKKKAGALKT